VKVRPSAVRATDRVERALTAEIETPVAEGGQLVVVRENGPLLRVTWRVAAVKRSPGDAAGDHPPINRGYDPDPAGEQSLPRSSDASIRDDAYPGETC
jgi:hypothetical protein